MPASRRQVQQTPAMSISCRICLPPHLDSPPYLQLRIHSFANLANGLALGSRALGHFASTFPSLSICSLSCFQNSPARGLTVHARPLPRHLTAPRLPHQIPPSPTIILPVTLQPQPDHQETVINTTLSSTSHKLPPLCFARLLGPGLAGCFRGGPQHRRASHRADQVVVLTHP